MLEPDVELAKQGDQQAFTRLYNEHHLKIVKMLDRWTNDWSEAEDITQEAFIKAFTKIYKFKGESTFYTWLWRIALNECRNWNVKWNVRRPPRHDLGVLENDLFEERTSEDIINGFDMQVLVQEVLDGCPEELRDTFVRRMDSDASDIELAEELGLPLGTIRSRVFRVRRRIEDKLRQAEKEGD